MIGTLDYINSNVYCEEHETYDARVFLDFLKMVLSRYSNGKIAIILDNARIHPAKLIQPFLEKVKNRLELVFLPPYSLEFNPIEVLWGWLKSPIISNAFSLPLPKVKVTIQKFIENINKVPIPKIDRLYVNM